MRTIKVSEADAGKLWQVLGELVHDDSQKVYLQIGSYKHWRKSAYISQRTEQSLLKIYNQLGWPKNPGA